MIEGGWKRHVRVQLFGLIQTTGIKLNGISFCVLCLNNFYIQLLVMNSRGVNPRGNVLGIHIPIDLVMLLHHL